MVRSLRSPRTASSSIESLSLPRIAPMYRRYISNRYIAGGTHRVSNPRRLLASLLTGAALLSSCGARTGLPLALRAVAPVTRTEPVVVTEAVVPARRAPRAAATSLLPARGRASDGRWAVVVGVDD